MWLLELLALSLLHFPLLLGMGLSMECGMGAGCDCVVAGSVVCSRAICSNGGPLGTPTQYQVDVSGLADGNCSANCAGVNGSYTITVTSNGGWGTLCLGGGGGAGTQCGGISTISGPIPNKVWQGTNGAGGFCPPPSPGTCPSATQSRLSLNFRAAQIEAVLVWNDAGVTSQCLNFVYASAAVDCSSLSSLNLQYSTDVWGTFGCQGAGSACSGASATVTVTTL